MPDLTDETLTKWAEDAIPGHYGTGNVTEQSDRVLALIDALGDARRERDEWRRIATRNAENTGLADARAEKAERALTVAHPQSAVLYMQLSADVREERARAEKAERERMCTPDEMCPLLERMKARAEKAERERDEVLGTYKALADGLAERDATLARVRDLADSDYRHVDGEWWIRSAAVRAASGEKS